ncbi:MAG TPA: outer membrane beta-barrel protein [Terriglobales bacterium]|nr:outer membrane beta-barrel protein [Terriglobales bacterium]
MHRSVVLGILVFFVVGLAQGARAQTSSEISVQASGLFTKKTTGAAIVHSVSDSTGLLVGYRFHINSWEAIEAEYGYTRSRQVYLATATNTGPGLRANMQQVIFNEVITTPKLFGVLEPFVLAGGGVVIFNPRGTPGFAATRQTKGAFNYGAGVNFHIFHLGARVEYQGLILKVPDFNNTAFNPDRWTHVAQPSLGLIFTF